MEKMNPGAKIRQLRLDAGMTQKQLSLLLNKSESAVRMWELGKNEPDITSLLSLSKIFSCTVDFLLGNEFFPGGGYNQLSIPYFASYRAATQDAQAVGTVQLPRRVMDERSQYFGLLVQDNAMSPFFQPRDLLIIQRQDTCFNGQHAAVLVAQEEAVIRKLIFQGDGVILQPANASFPALYYTAHDIDSLPLTVLGTVVYAIREVPY